jgi:hypothetical protein
MTTKTWNNSNADWYTPDDWSPIGVPGPTDDVVIKSGESQLLSGDAAIKVASISITSGRVPGVLALQDTEKTESVTGNVSITGPGSLQLDGPDIGGSGGSSLTIGGSLSNNGAVDTSPDTVTVNGKDGLSNTADLTADVTIVGSAAAQATLNIANAAAGFGTVGKEVGTVILRHDALLEFNRGQITTVHGTLELEGASARVADAGTTGSNSALTGLTTVFGRLWLKDGAKVAPTGNLSVNGSGSVQLDGQHIRGSGGTSLTIGGNLNNSSANINGVSIGNIGMTSADTLTVNGTGGLSNSRGSTISIEGFTEGFTAQATLNVANAAAGFGTTGVETGTVLLAYDALLEFNRGQITTVQGTLSLRGASARVADADDTGSNSALTGLTNVSGNFWLSSGATVATTGDVSVTGNGSLQLDGPYTGGSGGTSLTIGGDFTNNGTRPFAVYIGNSGLASADTVTVNGKGGLSNTGDINIGFGTAKLVVANTATNSGSGTIIDFGDLTATDVDFTGGTLLGFGTVTGALHDTGGTVLGGTRNSPGTLTVDGTYFQSGIGTLQTDINTVLAQPSSIVSVTGGPGTPGASGSVNLAGGTLKINAISALALNTPYTVMTFGANHLYGEFSKVETEGALGKFSGNSTSVNVGNGDTLDVLYNGSSGTIQVELVATPFKTTMYDWHVGSEWNASSTAAAFGEAHSLLQEPIRSSFVGSSDVMGRYHSSSAELNLAGSTYGHAPGGSA